INANFFHTGCEVGARKLGLILEHNIVQLPEIICFLLMNTKDCLRGIFFMIIEWQRVVIKSNLNFIAILLFNFVNVLYTLGTKWALEIREFNDCHFSIYSTNERCIAKLNIKSWALWFLDINFDRIVFRLLSNPLFNRHLLFLNF